jgi:hypothetical protein
MLDPSSYWRMTCQAPTVEHYANHGGSHQEVIAQQQERKADEKDEREIDAPMQRP